LLRGEGLWLIGPRQIRMLLIRALRAIERTIRCWLRGAVRAKAGRIGDTAIRSDLSRPEPWGRTPLLPKRMRLSTCKHGTSQKNDSPKSNQLLPKPHPVPLVFLYGA
jgi:hypothetical protein